MPTTTFITVVNRRNEPFVAPYALGVVHHNADAAVEIRVEERECFVAELDPLWRGCRMPSFTCSSAGGRFADTMPNAARFLETPEARADYTYGGGALRRGPATCRG
jgi:hypothetical protein